MKEYKISIVTPFHNVRTEVFKNAVESMKKQTLGFESIEWIIVFHNCEQKYIDGAMGLIAGYENVRTDIIYNDVRTPSSPRNHGMRMVTSGVLGFLDGDDSYTPWCLEQALAHKESTGAQIVWFRREFERENAGTIPMTEIVLWNQTYREIVIDRDENWDNEKLFSGVWGLVTSRIYDAAFLRDNDIWFDEAAYFAEDYLFNLEAYGYAKRLCYLPQMIGYHYFINSDSLVQKNEKTPAELIQYAVGFTHIFETGLKNGFYMDAIMGGLMYTEMRFMMGTPALTLADRLRIKEILEPYLNMLKPIRVSKLYSEKAVHERYAVVRDYLLHPEKWANGEDGGALFSGDLQQLGLNGNTDLLHSILEKNSATDMGRRYHFNDIVTIRGFKAMVPVSDYRTYEPLTALTSRIGESAIFVGEPVKYYIRFLTDGGRQRMLPVTESHLATYFPALDRACRGHVTFPLFEQLSLQNTYNDNTTSESVYAAVFQSYIEHKGKTGWGVDSRFVLPAAGLNDESSEDYYVRVLYALAEEKLTHIFAPNTYSVVRMMDFIQKNWRQLSGDLENGRISRRLEHPGSHTIKANPERAAKIREVMEKGATTRIVWPEFKCVTAKYDGEFQFYTNLLSQFMPGVEFRAADMIPEAMLGFSDGGNGFALNPEGGFFELKEDGADGLILPEEAKEGTNYRLYVTNQAGLYRYDTERYLRILRKEADGGTRYALNSGHDQAIGFGSIAVKPETLRRAAEQMQHEIGLRAVDYAFTLEKDEGLAMYIQPIASAQIGEAGVLAGKLDEYLRRACPGYAQERDAGRISPPKIRILNEETMHMFAETKAYKLRVAPDTVPLIHITEDPEYIRFLRAMAKE